MFNLISSARVAVGVSLPLPTTFRLRGDVDDGVPASADDDDAVDVVRATNNARR